MNLKYLSVVDSFFPDQPTGAGRVAWDVARQVCEWGHQATLLCHCNTMNAKDTAELYGVKVFGSPSAKVTPSLAYPDLVPPSKKIRETKKFLTSNRWDIVHIHTPFLGRLAFKTIGNGPRYVYTVHSPVVLEQHINWAEEGWRGILKRALGTCFLEHVEGSLLRKMERIQCLSDFTKKIINRKYGVGEKSQIIPHWCAKSFSRQLNRYQAREKLAWPQNGKIIISVRRLVARMGLEYAMDSVVPVLEQNPDLHYVIIGTGPLLTTLQRKAGKLGVLGQIHFLGGVNEDTLRLCYEAADLFILPTIALECFGLIALEAMAYGLPILSTDVGALPEIMEPVLGNFIVKGGDRYELRNKLQAWVEGRLQAPSGSALIGHVNEHYGQHAVTARLRNFLGIDHLQMSIHDS